MFDTVEEIDAELVKLKKRKKEAQEMIAMDTWGGLLRGSTKKAAVVERERELLAKREMLVKRGESVNYGERIKALRSSLSYLRNALENDHPELLESCSIIDKEIERIKESLDS